MNDNFKVLSSMADTVFDRLGAVGFAALSRSEQIFVCVWSAQGEIDNGGLDQFYYNSSGAHAVQTPDALRSIGANDLADIMTQANAFFPGGPANADAERQAQLAALSETQQNVLRELGDRFGEKAHQSVETLLFDFVQANRKDFKRNRCQSGPRG